jgi:peptidyl-prolyl cis-trans isomerase C
VKREMAGLPDMAKAFFQGAEGTSKFVDELVKRELLYLEAKKKGLDKAEDFQKKVEDFKKITLINQLLEKEIEAWSKIGDEEARQYYDTHREDFIARNQVRVSHILVKSEEDAAKVYERLRKGEDFGKVASELSLDKATAKSGGDLGSFKRGEMAKELEEAAFKLKKGEPSMPVKMKDGIHILKVTDVKGTAADFDTVKGAIVQRLTSMKQKEGFDKYIEDLKKTYKTEVNKDALAKLASPAAPSEKAEGHAKKEEKKETQEKQQTK